MRYAAVIFVCCCFILACNRRDGEDQITPVNPPRVAPTQTYHMSRFYSKYVTMRVYQPMSVTEKDSVLNSDELVTFDTSIHPTYLIFRTDTFARGFRGNDSIYEKKKPANWPGPDIHTVDIRNDSLVYRYSTGSVSTATSGHTYAETHSGYKK